MMTAGDDSLRTLLDLLPDEAHKALASTDLAIIPIGSIEQHGPHLLTGCDGYITIAKAVEVARLSGGVLFPMVNYCWEGATNVFSGGIGVRERVFMDYLGAVVRAVSRAGFKRILVVNSHGGNFYAMRAFPQHCLREWGIVVMTTYGSAFCPGAAHGENNVGEQALLLGALRILGREDLVEEVIGYTRMALAEFGDRPEAPIQPECLETARKLGVVGFDYSSEIVHVQPDSSQLDGDPGAAAIRKIAKHIADRLDALSAHVDDMGDMTDGA